MVKFPPFAADALSGIVDSLLLRRLLLLDEPSTRWPFAKKNSQVVVDYDDELHSTFHTVSSSRNMRRR
jgi:hypothetical protein